LACAPAFPLPSPWQNLFLQVRSMNRSLLFLLGLYRLRSQRYLSRLCQFRLLKGIESRRGRMPFAGAILSRWLARVWSVGWGHFAPARRLVVLSSFPRSFIAVGFPVSWF